MASSSCNPYVRRWRSSNNSCNNKLPINKKTVNSICNNGSRLNVRREIISFIGDWNPNVKGCWRTLSNAWPA